MFSFSPLLLWVVVIFSRLFWQFFLALLGHFLSLFSIFAPFIRTGNFCTYTSIFTFLFHTGDFSSCYSLLFWHIIILFSSPGQLKQQEARGTGLDWFLIFFLIIYLYSITLLLITGGRHGSLILYLIFICFYIFLCV